MSSIRSEEIDAVRAVSPMMAAALSALLAIIFWVTAAPVTAQELDLAISADTVTVGERFSILISARHEFASPAEFPAVVDSLVFGDVEILERVGGGTRSVGTGRIDSVVYEATTFALDTARVAPIPVLFTAGEDTFTVRTEAAFIPVASLVPPDAEDVQDLAPLVEFPLSIWRYVLAAAAFLLLAALIAFLIWRQRRRRGEIPPETPAEPPIPADVEALERLKALERADVSRREAVKPFYVELSDTLRTYLSRRLGVNALEVTTGELVAALRARTVPDEETSSRVRNILVQSDYVKFADAVPPAEESRSLLQLTLRVVETIERQVRPVPDEGVPEGTFEEVGTGVSGAAEDGASPPDASREAEQRPIPEDDDGSAEDREWRP